MLSMNLKLYYNFFAPTGRAVYIFLKTNNILFEEKFVDFKKGEQFLPEFQKINPMQEIPVIQHNGFNLAQCGAIFRYLCSEFDVSDHWYPRESQARARVDEFLHWNHGFGKPNTIFLYNREYRYARFRGEPPKPESVHQDHLIIKYIEHIDKRWLCDKPFVIGHQITTADILAACYAEQFEYAGFEVREKQRLSKWLDRVSRVTQPYYQEAHELIDKLKSHFSKTLNTVAAKI